MVAVELDDRPRRACPGGGEGSATPWPINLSADENPIAHATVLMSQCSGILDANPLLHRHKTGGGGDGDACRLNVPGYASIPVGFGESFDLESCVLPFRFLYQNDPWQGRVESYVSA